ncbi:MAG TPA: hypothetical protein VLX28_07500 [Thermoanaerobaculia bacterium]|nr:hypothetical protein [Thermoanaerobaculia bacterium]
MSDPLEESFDLIPELKDWNNGRGISVADWIGCVGSFEHAIGYSFLFWPEFVEFDGCIFFKTGFREENYRGFMTQTGGNRRAVEAVMNHCHICDLFGDPELDPTRAQIVFLGRMLKEMWAAKLQRDFPARPVTVTFPEDELDNFIDYQVTFYQTVHT